LPLLRLRPFRIRAVQTIGEGAEISKKPATVTER